MYPPQLSNTTTRSGEDVSIYSVLDKEPVSLVIFTQKRVTAERQVEEWVNGFASTFPDVPIIEVFVEKRKFELRIVGDHRKQLWLLGLTVPYQTWLGEEEQVSATQILLHQQDDGC